VSFHILRHSWASLAVMAGVPLLVVAKNLGHADTRMVENITGIWHRATSLTPSALHGLVIHRGTIVPLPSGKPAAL
jgi:integrase